MPGFTKWTPASWLPVGQQIPVILVWNRGSPPPRAGKPRWVEGTQSKLLPLQVPIPCPHLGVPCVPRVLPIPAATVPGLTECWGHLS